MKLRCSPLPLSLALMGKRSLLQHLTVGSILLSAGGAYAAGLGAALNEPVIGQPLGIEIPLTDANAGLSASCFQITRPGEITDPENFPSGATARIVSRGGDAFVRIVTDKSIRTPIVEFRVEIRCGHSISREYLLLSALQPASKPATEALPTTTALAAGNPKQTVIEKPTINPESSGQLPDGLSAKTHLVEQTMQLQNLAQQYFPGQPKRAERFMRWVVEANPALFQEATSLRTHLLHKGASLLVPVGIPPRRSGDHPGEKTRIDMLDSPTSSVRPAASATTKSTPRAPGPGPSRLPSPAIATMPADNKKDRLLVSGGVINAALLKGSNAKDFAVLATRLGELEDSHAADRDQLNDRIDRLETLLVQFSDYAVKLETQARQRDVQWQAEREASRREARQPQWVQLVAAVLMGGVLGAAVLAWVNRRKPVLASAFAETGDAFQRHVEPREAPTAAQRPIGESASESFEAYESLNFAATPSVSTQHVDAQSLPTPHHAPVATSNASRSSWEFEPVALADSVNATSSAADDAEPPAIWSEDEAEMTMELACLMVSMGLTDAAARTLLEFTKKQPRKSPLHWLKLLELLRQLGQEQEFSATATEVHKHFNINPPRWQGKNGVSAEAPSIEDYPHIVATLQQSWPREDCIEYLQSLLADHRNGTRGGFPLEVAEDILLLMAMKSQMATRQSPAAMAMH